MISRSGRQRQRIAIACALLEEATSALEAASETLVQDAPENPMVGRTALVTAHRLSTVARANRVVVLEEGRVVEIGAHTVLMHRGEKYRCLVERQLVPR